MTSCYLNPAAIIHMAAPKIHWSVKTGHTSIYSTVEDLQKFADAVLNKELLSQESWNAILTNHGDSVGYGWFLNPQKDHKRYQINGRSPGFCQQSDPLSVA